MLFESNSTAAAPAETSSRTDDATSREVAADRRDERVLLGASLLIVVVPIVVATVRTLARGWLPMGDSALLLVRSRDVFTRHHPLLGSWSSSSLVTGKTVNNPGPLYHDLTALPIKVLGPWVGVAVGVMLVNVAMVILAVIVARRTGGTRAMVAVTLAIALLEFSMGSELLFDVWQPNATVLVFFAFVVTVWGLATGDLALAPWVLGLGSLLVQTHLSYAYLVLLLTVFAAAWAGAAAWRRDHALPRGPLLASGVVIVLAWVQPLIDQFAGEGNLTALMGAAGGGEGEATGFRLGTRLAGNALVLSGWWTRDSYSNAIPPSRVTTDLPVAGFVAAALVLLVALAVFVAVTLTSRFHAKVRLMTAVAAVAIVGCWLSAAVMPTGVAGLSPHQARWMWPTAAFATAALVYAAATIAPRSWRGLAAVTTLAAVVAVANLPTHVTATGPTAERRYQPSAMRLLDQLGPLEDRGTVLVDTSTLVFAEPYSGPIFAELQDRGIEFVVPQPDERQLGESRHFDPGDESIKLRVWSVMGTPRAYDDPRVEIVASVRPVSDDELDELDALERELREYIRTNGLVLSGRGRDAVRSGLLPYTQAELDERVDPFDEVPIAMAVDEGWLTLAPSARNDFERYSELALMLGRGTVTVYSAPIDFEP